jgi:hypothetical protein
LREPFAFFLFSAAPHLRVNPIFFFDPHPTYSRGVTQA